MIYGTICWWSSRPHILTIKTLVNSRTDLDPAYMEKTGLGPAGPVIELLTYLCYPGFPYKTWRILYMRKKSLTRLGRLPAQPGHPPCWVNFSPYFVSPSWVNSVKARQSSCASAVLSSSLLEQRGQLFSHSLWSAKKKLCGLLELK